MKFIPYAPPNAENSLVEHDGDIAWRIRPDGLVDETVVAAVAWAMSRYCNSRQKQALLDGLGLHWKEGRTGGVSLEPKFEHLIAAPAPLTEQQVFDACKNLRNGGSFASSLADTISLADSTNQAKLLAAFDDLIRSNLSKAA